MTSPKIRCLLPTGTGYFNDKMEARMRVRVRSLRRRRMPGLHSRSVYRRELRLREPQIEGQDGIPLLSFFDLAVFVDGFAVFDDAFLVFNNAPGRVVLARLIGRLENQAETAPPPVAG